jgi:U3 small nucleolar RNA-associated protein 10
MKNIQAFAETFLSNPNKYLSWLADSGNGSRFCRTLFLLIVLQAFLIPTEGISNLCSYFFALSFLVDLPQLQQQIFGIIYFLTEMRLSIVDYSYE